MLLDVAGTDVEAVLKPPKSSNKGGSTFGSGAWGCFGVTDGFDIGLYPGAKKPPLPKGAVIFGGAAGDRSLADLLMLANGSDLICWEFTGVEAGGDCGGLKFRLLNALPRSPRADGYGVGGDCMAAEED